MFKREIIEKTRGEIRSFLDELANGTSRYRTLGMEGPAGTARPMRAAG